MYFFTACILIATLCWLQCIAYKCDTAQLNSNALSKLQYRFFAVYFPATFADWLQGPYLYKLYSSYGFREDDIFLLYILGFASSVMFGTCISALADYYGRRKMCVIFNVFYLLSCLSKLSTKFEILVAGRVLGGIGTSILFSVFEAWYIHQHVEKHQFPISWVHNTLSKVTFFNGLLAIISGLISNTFVEVLEMGPVSPFLLAIPCLILSGTLAVLLWDEAYTLQSMLCIDVCNMANILLKKDVILLCLVQSIFESVMYVFIILWTPVLSPISPPIGIVFSCFMLCIMIGSTLHKCLVAKKYKPNFILTITILLASIALGACAVAEISYTHSSAHLCFIAFLFYEVAVGLYYPVMGFVRSCVIPECYRATLTSWFRLPMNLITCFCLFYFRRSQLTEKSSSYKVSSVANSDKMTSNAQIFTTCALALLGASKISRNLCIFSDHRDMVQNVYNY